MGEFVKEILKHNISAASRLIRIVEDELPEADKELEKLYPFTGNSHIIGITGLPGAGKSTLINNLILKFRKQNKSIGVLASDPSSPYTGGAVLGDRIRLMDHSTDKDVLIKSLATRGWQGGVAKTVLNIINIMDAFGKDVIMIETAGVGQTEVDIMNIAHTIIVVLVPEMGDYIQTLKAGILEIADIFVINKSDKNKDNDLIQNLNAFLNIDRFSEFDWKPEVIATDALKDKGINTLINSIEKHKKYFDKFEREKYELKKAKYEIDLEIKNFLIKFLMNNIEKSKFKKDLIKSIVLKKIYPKNAAIEILKKSGYIDFNKKSEGDSII